MVMLVLTTSMDGHVHTYSDQRYMLYLESTYGTDRKYWFRNEGTLQLGEELTVIHKLDLPLIPIKKWYRHKVTLWCFDCHYSGTSVFKVQSDGDGGNPGNYGNLIISRW